MQKLFLLATAAASLVGCADQMMSSDRIRTNTAMALHQSPASVSITDRQFDGMTNTYYVARTPTGSYNCVINGGGLLAMGLTNAPDCSPTSTPLVRRRIAVTP